MSVATDPASNPLLGAALGYARRGWWVFPLHDVAGGECSCGHQNAPAPDGKLCNSPGKHPRTSHGFQDSTLDEEKIALYWGAWPTANIGIDCGRSNLTVVDVDVKNGAQGRATLKWVLERHAAAFSAAELVSSPTGGYHYYMTGAGAWPHNAFGPGIDLQSTGRYVVAPPSRAFGQYDDAKRPVAGSQAPYALLRPAIALPALPPLADAGFHLGDIAGRERTFDGEERSAIPYGEHRSSLLWFAWHLRRVQGFTVEAGVEEMRAYLERRLDGYNPTVPFTDADLRGMLTRLEPHIASEPPKVISNPFEGVITGLEAAADERSITWLVPYFLQDAVLASMFGPGGVGKSTLASWVSSIVTGLDENFGVVGVEEPFSLFCARAAAMGAQRSKLIGLTEPAVGLKYREHLDWIERFIVEKQLKALYFDSMRTHFEQGKGEDSATNTRNNLAGIADLALRTGCLILGTFHTNKNDVYSGSTEMLNVPRIVLELKEITENQIGLRVHKTNGKSPSFRKIFNRDEVPHVNIRGEQLYQTFREPGQPARSEIQTLPVWRFVRDEPLTAFTLGEVAAPEKEDEIRALLTQNPKMSGRAIFDIVGGNSNQTFKTVARIKRDG